MLMCAIMERRHLVRGRQVWSVGTSSSRATDMERRHLVLEGDRHRVPEVSSAQPLRAEGRMDYSTPSLGFTARVGKPTAANVSSAWSSEAIRGKYLRWRANIRFRSRVVQTAVGNSFNEAVCRRPHQWGCEETDVGFINCKQLQRSCLSQTPPSGLPED